MREGLRCRSPNVCFGWRADVSSPASILPRIAAVQGNAMNDWFRNAEWNEEIAAAFEARLSRARQKAEYLNIQGYMLLATLPAIAGELLRRAIALDDPGQTARACLYLGTALAGTGDLDSAIAALEAGME